MNSKLLCKCKYVANIKILQNLVLSINNNIIRLHIIFDLLNHKTIKCTARREAASEREEQVYGREGRRYRQIDRAPPVGGCVSMTTPECSKNAFEWAPHPAEPCKLRPIFPWTSRSTIYRKALPKPDAYKSPNINATTFLLADAFYLPKKASATTHIRYISSAEISSVSNKWDSN